MVNEITPEQMVPQTTKAKALDSVTKSGKGTPIEARMAEAVLEQAHNTEKQMQAYSELVDAIKAATETAAEAAKDAANGLQTVEKIDERIVFVVKQATERRLVEVIPTGANSIIENAQARLGEASDIVTAQIEESAAKAAMVIEKSVKAAEEREQRARTLDRRHQLSLIGKVAACTVIVGTCLLIMFAGWRFLPIVTGEVKITYTEEFQSKLDATEAELARTCNELNAYKDAYPEGLSEQRLHDLNEQNAKVQ
ncbi:MAG: hypothetical protein RR842_08500 [Gordonibacter sp.]|uniref:hypothetical protein n=1 Tax=Gordonibacter sp. TaxID=1968902 RepID=UPI002FC67896